MTFAPNGFGEPAQAVRTRGSEAAYNYATGASWYPNGAINTFSYGNGLTHKTALNSRKLPQSVRDHNGSVNALYYSYGYDNNLNVTTLTDHKDSAFSLTSLTYDGLDRLTNTAGGSGIGSSTIDYDGLGNITNTSFNGLTFNRANQVTNATTTTGSSNTFVYDGHNRRVKKTSSNGIEYSFYGQHGTLLYRENQANGGGINYIYLDKKLIAKDGFIPEDSGKQHYRPYGDSIEGAADDVGYTGHKFDKDLGLSYMQARYYDPVIGRFYSNDPVGYTAKNPVMSFNRYLYVNNNPYKYTDPNGEFLLQAVGAIVGGYTAYSAAVNNGASTVDTILATAGGAIIGGLTGHATAGKLAVEGAKAAFKTAMTQSGAQAAKTVAQGAGTGALVGAETQAVADLATTGTTSVENVATAAAKGGVTGALAATAPALLGNSVVPNAVGTVVAEGVMSLTSAEAAESVAPEPINDDRK